MIMDRHAAMGMLNGLGEWTPGDIPATIPANMIPADFWQLQQYGSTVIPGPGSGVERMGTVDLQSQILSFSERNIHWILIGTVALVALIMLTGGGRR